VATFRFYFVVEIIEETSRNMKLDLDNMSSIVAALSGVDEDLIEADVKCDHLMKALNDRYFPEITLELHGSGYNVSDRLRENFYIVTFENIDLAELFLEKIDKILYDFKDADVIRINKSSAYINREYFAKKVVDFGHEIVAYKLLKNLTF